MSKAVLLLNLGTPAAPTAKGLRDFYKYFFSDPFVFDINPVGRWLLRNLIILPFRAPKTAKDYASIWMEDGSPLKVYADRLQFNLQLAFEEAGEDVLVVTGMGYSQPFIGEAMQELERLGRNEILVFPMFPQYSTATTASLFHEIDQCAAKWKSVPQLKFIYDFFSEPDFIRAWSVLITEHLVNLEVDHVVFSYHGLPESNLKKADKNSFCTFGGCCNEVGKENRYCYRAQCVATTESIVTALGWEKDQYSIAFQSRFGRQEWIKPYLDEHLIKLLEDGIKNVAIVTPSFTSDCLETIHEIGVEYRHQYLSAGGDSFHLIPNLNDQPSWFRAVYNMSKDQLN